jgi:hypothetical protein
MNKTCILIQTNDEYEFLWEGLFLSWHLNWMWEKFDLPVFVITETKEFKNCHSSCTFETIKVGEDISSPSHYSTKLLRGLQFLKNKGFENLIYCQDDSWPHTSPDSLILEGIFKMFEEENLDVFYFHEHRSNFPFTLKNTNRFILGKRVREFFHLSRFYYNHGCGVWKIDSLQKIQTPGEAAYENESMGTIRAWGLKIKAYLLNYPWYNQDLIHNKGEIKQTGISIIQDLKFRFAWEKKENFMYNYIAQDGSIIPVTPEDFIKMSDEERKILYNESHGHRFCNYL